MLKERRKKYPQPTGEKNFGFFSLMDWLKTSLIFLRSLRISNCLPILNLRTCPYMKLHDFNEWMEFLGFQNVNKPLESWWKKDGMDFTGFVTKSRKRLFFHTKRMHTLTYRYSGSLTKTIEWQFLLFTVSPAPKFKVHNGKEDYLYLTFL